jgi:Ser/Thr protein kinase RdoA (MazF antagonist)
MCSLAGADDRNFYFRAKHDRPELHEPSHANAIDVTAPYPFQFVLKIHNGVESLEAAFIECQCQAMDAVRAAGGVWCPRALPSLDGKSIAFAPSKLRNGTERNHAVRLLPYRSAELLANVVASASLLRKLGRETAKASAALMAFDHPAAHRTFIRGPRGYHRQRAR